MPIPMRRRDFIAALSALDAAPNEFAQSAAPMTVRYARTPGVPADLQSLDIYGAASPAQKRPIMAFIHGGGWEFVEKANIHHGRDKAGAFVPRGLVLDSLKYRISPAV